MNSRGVVGDPAAVALDFATTHSASGFRLDFSLESLETEIDRLLALPIFFRGGEGSRADEESRNQAGISAYVGETLRRLFQGRWGGEFYPDRCEINFYTSFVDFAGYRYWPSHFISYRLTNWPGEGTFAQHLERALPAIRKHLTQEGAE